MQISTQDAVRLGFVQDENRTNLDHSLFNDKASFDLEFKTILTLDEKSQTIVSSDSIENLKPQQCAYLVSKQFIRIPKGYIAYVFLKNRMCQRGLLALNTGIIDQGYYGPISTLVINLSKKHASIPNDNFPNDRSFFRVVFHKFDSNDNCKLISETSEDDLDFSNSPHSYDQYLGGCKSKLRDYPENFLNTAALEDRLQNEIEKKAGDFSIRKLSVYLALLAVVFTLLPALKDYYFTWKFDLKDYSHQIIENQNSMEKLTTQIQTLEAEITGLKAQISKVNESSTPDDGRTEPVLVQHLNITASPQIDHEVLKEELFDNIFAK